MNLYLISQNVNNGFETYDGAVVCADTEDDARMIHPYSSDEYSGKDYENWDGEDESFSNWCAAKDVKVRIIGAAACNVKRGVVLASYNAG